jgi:hypothetical protein
MYLLKVDVEQALAVNGVYFRGIEARSPAIKLIVRTAETSDVNVAKLLEAADRALEHATGLQSRPHVLRAADCDLPTRPSDNFKRTSPRP